MKKSPVVSLFALLCATSSLVAQDRSDPPVVQTVNYPLAYFAERIGGKAVEVEFLAPKNGDPAFWKPTANQLAEIQQADLILLNGATYAKWLTTASLPDSITVDTSSSYRGSLITVKNAHSHTHGDGTVHSHDGVAFTTWLDLSLAAKQAGAVRTAILDLFPADAEAVRAEITANATQLIGEIQALDADFKAVATEIGDKPIVGSHPVYQYLAKRYGLNIESVHWEPETVPNPAARAELMKVLADHDAKSMIWEAKPAMKSSRLLKEIGIESLVIDPCGNRPKRGDWIRVMQQNLKALKGLM